MQATAERTLNKPTLHPEFVENMVRSFNDPDQHGVRRYGIVPEGMGVVG